jgi:coenzyme F420-reducing hydrogenase delta subunit
MASAEEGKAVADNPEIIAGDIPPDWKANIIAFACHYCAFAAADLAGVMRLSYSPNVKVIRLPCTGKLDHSYVMRAFERGIDGVFVAG